jgi:hypothetical protein
MENILCLTTLLPLYFDLPSRHPYHTGLRLLTPANSDYFPIQNGLTGFYNRDGVSVFIARYGLDL